MPKNASGMKDTFLVLEHENQELTMLHNCDFMKREWVSEEDLKALLDWLLCITGLNSSVTSPLMGVKYNSLQYHIHDITVVHIISDPALNLYIFILGTV